MKRSSAILLSLSLVSLAGCSGSAQTVSRSAWMQNPLVADRYETELTEQMVNIEIAEKATLSKDTARAALVKKTKEDSMSRAKDAQKKIREGLFGSFVAMVDGLEGSALLRPEALYLGTDLLAYPGPNMHLYVSTVLDPREGEFPDATAIDLGELQSPYNAQTYALPKQVSEKLDTFRTLALYDKDLKKLYGFAQISK